MKTQFMQLPDSLVDDSTLSPVMVESLSSYLEVLRHEMTLKEAAASRLAGPVTIGSYYRTVQQAKQKIRSSILTVVIALWLDAVGTDDLSRLFDSVGKGLTDLDESERDRAVVLVEALVDKIVMPK